MDAELKPCPFCGDRQYLDKSRVEQRREHDLKGDYVLHNDNACPLAGLMFEADSWNRRDPAVARAAAEKMRNECKKICNDFATGVIDDDWSSAARAIRRRINALKVEPS